MKPNSLPQFLLLAAAVALPLSALAQAPAPGAAPTPPKPHIIYYVPHPHISAASMARLRSGMANTSTIPLWNFDAIAYDGSSNPGMMVGRSPFAHGHRTTTIPTFVVPVILKITNSGTGQVETFDPTVPDACAPKGTSVDTQLVQSPIFQTSDFVMNGVDVGSAQYLDAFQRGNFWALVGGTPYHTTFATNPTVLPTVTITVPSNMGDVVPKASFGGCRDLGIIDFTFFITMAEGGLVSSLPGAGPTTFPQLIFDSVAMERGAPFNLGHCGCLLGFHDSFTDVNGHFQTYSANDYDLSGVFGNGNTGVLSHEVAEWMDDPNGGNPVPAWGAEGQVTAGNCQGNLEVGDPLSPSFGTPSNPFTVTGTNGTMYTLQELAFYSWFIGDVPSLGAGGAYSDNGTFPATQGNGHPGHAGKCPPGGLF